MSSSNITPGQLTVITLFTTAAPQILVGAACGALVYMLNAKKLTIVERALHLLISFAGGLLAGETFASVIEGSFKLISIQAAVSPAVGAFLSAAAIINLSTKFGANPLGFIKKAREAVAGNNKGAK